MWDQCKKRSLQEQILTCQESTTTKTDGALKEAKHNYPNLWGKKIKGTRCPGNEEYQKVSKQTDRHSLRVRNNTLMSCNEKEKSKAKEIKCPKNYHRDINIHIHSGVEDGKEKRQKTFTSL